MLGLKKRLTAALESEDAAEEQRTAWLRRIVKLILIAAIVTAPLHVVGETFDLSHLARVLSINGGTALGAAALLLLVDRGHVRWVSAFTVWGLFAVIAVLAATNGEPINTEVINFVLVLVLANMLLTRGGVMLVVLACALAMIAIASHQSTIANSAHAGEKFIETIVQFVPQFILLAVLLRRGFAKIMPTKSWQQEARRQ